MGALKRARVVRPGTAEVIYLNKPDAVAACRKYHNRELDGQPMQVWVYFILFYLFYSGAVGALKRDGKPMQVSVYVLREVLNTNAIVSVSISAV